MLRLRLTNTKKRQFTQLLPLGSELYIGKERCCLRGIDQLHGPTFHSICGNLIIYKPSLKNPFIFEHDGSLRAIIDLLPITAPLYQNEEVEKKYIYFFFHFFHGDRSWRNREHNSFPLWLTVFPEKRFSFSNQFLKGLSLSLSLALWHWFQATQGGSGLCAVTDCEATACKRAETIWQWSPCRHSRHKRNLEAHYSTYPRPAKVLYHGTRRPWL